MAHHAGGPEVLVLPVGVIHEGRVGIVVLGEIPEEGRHHDGGGLVDAGSGQLGHTGGVVVLGVVGHAALHTVGPVGVVTGFYVQLGELLGVEQVDLVTQLLDAVREVVGDGSLVLITALGGDEHDTGSAAGTVDSGRSGILQDFDALDIVGVDEVVIGNGIAVHHVQGGGAGGKGVDTADADVHTCTGSAFALTDFHTGYAAHEGLSQGGGGFLQLVGFDGGHRAGKVALTHGSVTDDDGFLQEGAVLGQDDIYLGGTGKEDFLGGKADAGKFQGFSLGCRDGIVTGGVRDHAPSGSALHHDTCTDDGFAVVVHDRALDHVVLCCQAEGSRDKQAE